MNEEEILTRMIFLLEAHYEGSLGSMHQRDYKDSFFTLFRDAYRQGFLDESCSPRFTADALRDILQERWIRSKDKSSQAKANNHLETLLRMWREWQYACDSWPVM